MAEYVTRPTRQTLRGGSIPLSQTTKEMIQDEVKKTSKEMERKIDLIDEQLSDFSNYEIKATDFGVKMSNPNNYNEIMNALNKLKENGGGRLKLPFGTIRTSPIDLRGFDNIVIQGVGRSVPYSTATTIQIVGNNPIGSVGIQMSETVNPIEEFDAPAKFCRVEGFFLECDYNVDFGINGNLGLQIHDVMVRRARIDGIILEDWSYPVYITQSASQYNGRHGIYAKGRMSTAYSVYQCEFSYNNGYGVLIEGGGSVSLRDSFSQANKIGGIKINYKEGYTDPYFLENIKFDNMYTEGNGLLSSEHSDYEGNFAFIVTGYDKTNNALRKAKNIEYEGVLNSPSNGKSLKIDSVYGCKIKATMNGVIEIGNTGVIGLEFETSPSIASLPMIENGTALTSYFHTKPLGKIINGLHYANRGNVHAFEFTLPEIQPGESKLMNVSYTGIPGLNNGYKAIREGSIIGVSLYKGNNNGEVAGSLILTPKYSDLSFGLFVEPSFNFSNFIGVEILSEEIQKKSTYEIGDYSFQEHTILGLEVTASEDYLPGFNKSLVAYLIVEW